MKYLNASHSYHHDSLMWCHPKRPISLSINFIYLCTDFKVYVAFAITCVVVISSTYIGQMFEDQRMDWNRLVMNGMACFFYCPCHFVANGNVMRIGFIFFLFGTFLFNTILSAKLMVRITKTTYVQQLESFDEIIENDFDFIGDHFAMVKLMELNKVPELCEHFIDLK